MDCSVRGQSTTKAPSTTHPAVRAKPMNCRWRLANTECPHALPDIGERHDTGRHLKARTVLHLLSEAPQPCLVEIPAETLEPHGDPPSFAILNQRPADLPSKAADWTDLPSRHRRLWTPDAIRGDLNARGTKPIIPPKSNPMRIAATARNSTHVNW